MEHFFIITAAGPKNWRREYLDPRALTRWMGESIIGDYKDKMDKLREVDSRIREWTKDFDKFIFNINRELKNALNSNRFIDLAKLLAELNQTLKNVSIAGKEIENLEEDSFQDFDTEHDEYLDPELFNSNDGFVSEAGFFSDLKRKWVANKLETKKREQRKIALQRLVSYAKTIIGHVNFYLDEMDKARAYGQIGNYINNLNKISKEQKNFEKMFKGVYNTYLKNMVEQVLSKQKIENEESNKKEESNFESEQRDTLIQAPIQEAFSQPKIEDPQAQLPEQQKQLDLTKEKQEQDKTEEHISNEDEKNVQTSEQKIRKVRGPQDLQKDDSDPNVTKKTTRKKKNEDKIKKSFEISDHILKYDHLKFLGKLIQLSNIEDPGIIATAMIDYAGKIDDQDPNASIALTKIAEKLLK